MDDLKQLAPDQLESFNNESIKEPEWDILFERIDSRFRHKPFTFLDIGGGNGLCADRIVDRYPESQAILLDNAANLIGINEPHPRKKIINDSAANLKKYLDEYTVDLVLINWVLHHLVSASWRKTLGNVSDLLETIRGDRNVRFVSVFEISYNGILFDNLPGRVIFGATSIKSIAPLMQKMGANTAGVGVAFRSKRAWMNIFRGIFGKDAILANDFEIWETPLRYRLFLHIGKVHESLFWITNHRRR